MLRALIVALLLVVAGCSGPPKPTITLHKAAQTGDVDQLGRHLHHGCDVNEKDAEGLTPLTYACRARQAGAVELLLDSGADINAEAKIQPAAAQCGDVAIASAVLGLLPPDSRQRIGPVLMGGAASEGHINVLEWGAANGFPMDGRTVMLAVLMKQADAVRWLVKHGVKADAAMPTGETPGEYAAAKGMADVVAALEGN